MGRPYSQGLSYFQLDCNLDPTKMGPLEAAFGNDGFAVFIKLLQTAYQTSAGEVKFENQMHKAALAKNANVSPKRYTEIVDAMLEIGLLDSEAFAERKVLTSNGIRKQLKKTNLERRNARKRRKNSSPNKHRTNTEQLPNKTRTTADGSRVVRRTSATSNSNSSSNSSSIDNPPTPLTDSRLESNEEREARLAAGFVYPHASWPEAQGDMRVLLDRVADHREDFTVKRSELIGYQGLLRDFGAAKMFSVLADMQEHWRATPQQFREVLSGKTPSKLKDLSERTDRPVITKTPNTVTPWKPGIEH